MRASEHPKSVDQLWIEDGWEDIFNENDRWEELPTRRIQAPDVGKAQVDTEPPAASPAPILVPAPQPLLPAPGPVSPRKPVAVPVSVPVSVSRPVAVRPVTVVAPGPASEPRSSDRVAPSQRKAPESAPKPALDKPSPFDKTPAPPELKAKPSPFDKKPSAQTADKPSPFDKKRGSDPWVVKPSPFDMATPPPSERPAASSPSPFDKPASGRKPADSASSEHSSPFDKPPSIRNRDVSAFDRKPQTEAAERLSPFDRPSLLKKPSPFDRPPVIADVVDNSGDPELADIPTMPSSTWDLVVEKSKERVEVEGFQPLIDGEREPKTAAEWFDVGFELLRRRDKEGARRAWTIAVAKEPDNRLYKKNLDMLDRK